MPTPAGRYRQNAQLTLLEPGEFSPVVPTPVRLERGEGEWRLDGAVQIHHAAELESEAGYLTESLEPLLGKSLELEAGGSGGPRAVLLRTGRVSAGEAEAYRLTVDAARGVEIVGSDAAGVFYGIQTLRGWISPSAYAAAEESLSVPAVRVEDAPRFAYRGQHLDVARNFQPKTTVLKLLDLMAFYKLNRFHIHLTDDEGWRWEVRELPELTEVGGRRGHTADERDRLIPSYGSGPFPDPNLSSGSGWYTRQDMVEILRHARRRHIQVIPEIDVPGHARAAIRATEARAARLEAAGDLEGAEEFRLVDPEDESEYRSIQGFDDNVVDPCRESTYRFLGTVFDELIVLYREAEAPLRVVHIGGDEVPEGVWEGSPSCRALTEEGESDLPAYFLRRVSRLLAERGLVTGGWDEIGLAGGEAEGDKSPNLEFAGEGFQVWVWNSIWGTRGAKNAYRLANAGYPVVLSNAASLYLDMAYEKDPREPGQAWAGYVDTRKLFEFTPLDIYQSGRSDFMGRPIDPASLRNATRLTAEGRRNVLGIQGQLWAEVLHTPQRMEYMAFPKLLGLAERAWAAQPDWARLAEGRERERALALAWNRFANTLGQRELWRLDYLYGGVEYRLPPPGVVEEGGEVEVNVGFPGLEVKVEGREAVVVSRTGRWGRRSVLE